MAAIKYIANGRTMIVSDKWVLLDKRKADGLRQIRVGPLVFGVEESFWCRNCEGQGCTACKFTGCRKEDDIIDQKQMNLMNSSSKVKRRKARLNIKCVVRVFQPGKVGFEGIEQRVEVLSAASED